MDPVLNVALLWLLFGGCHVLLAVAPVRERLVARFGRLGFLYGFVLVASVTFALLVAGYARVQQLGPAGPALGDHPVLRTALTGVSYAGIVSFAAALAPSAYWDSPSAVMLEGVRPPRGIARVTRHPAFAGIVFVFGAHALLSRHLTGVVFASGFVLLAILGPLHQAKKLRARHGAAFDAYLRETSAVPFAAILGGRQRLVLAELPWKTLAVGTLVAVGIHRVHAGIMAYSGAPLISFVVGGSLVIGAIGVRRARRSHPSVPPP
jgi:uncharacterized membrane protein